MSLSTNCGFKKNTVVLNQVHFTMDPQRELLQLEQQMRRADCVLEPDILQVLRRYVQCGGKPDTAVELLADSYVGYAQMAQLMCQWLALASGEAPPEAMYDPEVGGNTLLGMLEEMAFERFDPRIFKGIFKKGGSGPPSWLEGIVQDPFGRQLVYDLSSRHRTCLLLNFAIQRILSLGKEKEVAEVGGPLTGFFDVFSRIFAARLEAAAVSGDPSSTEAAIETATRADEQTYIYALLVLTRLGHGPLGGPFRAVASAIQRVVGEAQGPGVWQMASQLSPALLPPFLGAADRRAYRAAAMLLQSRYDPSGPLQHLTALYFPTTAPAADGGGSGAGRRVTSPKRVGRGGEQAGASARTPQSPRSSTPHGHQWRHRNGGSPQEEHGGDANHEMASLAPIQHLAVLQHLMGLLFSPTRQLPLQDQQRARRLLALACSADVVEHRPAAQRGHQHSAPGTASAGPGAPTTPRTAARTPPTPTLDSSAGKRAPPGLEVEQGELTYRMTTDEAESVLEKAMQVARGVINGSDPHEHDLGVATILPAACTGMVHQMMWHVDEVGIQLLSPATTRSICKAGLHIFQAQPQLSAHVLALFRDVVLSPGTESGTRAEILDAVLTVLLCHNSSLALGWLSHFAAHAAVDDAQYALYSVLAQCGPPYSPEFVATALDLMRASHLRGPQDCPEGSAWRALLSELAHEATPELFQAPAVRAAMGHETVEAYLDQLWVLRKGAKVDAAQGG